MTLTRSPATATATVVGGGKGAAATGALYPLRTRFTTVAVLTLLLLLLLLLDAPAASALNTCEEITRCSECVYDQTQGIMPPSLQCGWCASTQTCKEVNATVLAYYGVHKSTGNKHQTRTTTDDENNESEFTPEEMAAFVASFCPDLREREVNGECPDMTCIAAKTTNNIYICRPPPIIALVFGCLLFVLTVVVFVWMRAIRQLPWRYEPFLSDMLEGRLRSYDETAMEEEEEEEGEDGDYSAENEDDDHEGNKDGAHRAGGRGGQLSSSTHHSTPFPQRARAGGDKLNATRPGSPFTDGPQPPSQLQESEEEAAGRKQQQQQQKSNRSNNGKGEYASPSSSSSSSSYANDSPSAETASTASNPSYIGEASHNVVVSHRPHTTTTTTTTTAAAAPTHAAAAALSSALAGAATGYCPICKCRQPAYLGPGEVCFWCNVARFTFVPFTIALICAVTVILLDFAVSLKPWFSDWYFSMVLLFAYASYGGMALYMVRHHGRAPLFFFESEAERRANQRIWTATHDRPASALLSASVPPSQPESAKRTSRHRHGSGGEGSSHHARHPHHRQSPSASSRRERAASPSRALDQKWHHDRQKLRMLNDARRNMASTYYFHLALQLRGRSLLEVFPELKRYTAQLEALQATPATLTAVGDVMAVMRTPGTANNTGGSSPQSPLGAQFNNPSHHHHGSPNAATATATAAAGDDGAVPVISPFSTAMPRANADADSRNSSSTTNNNNNVAATAPLMGLPLGDDGSPHTLSSPSVSSGYYSSGGAATDHGRLPTLAAVAAMTTPPASQLQTPVPEGAAQPGGSGGAAALQQPQPTPTPAAAGGGGGGSNPIGANAAVATNAMPEALARQKRGETVQLLSSDFLSPQYCRALKSTLYRDEYITWCAKPNMRGVLMENEWLLLVLAAGFLFGLWMVMLASVTDTTYTIVQLSGSTSVSACGLIVMAFFAVLLVIVVRQCGRLYVLTNERLITVYESVITPVTTATDLSTVRFAALYGYRSLLSKQPCLTFSWEVPATERKMPVIKSHKFPGITHLQEFLFFFRLVAPQTPFHLEQISESTRQDRQEWRLHIILCVVAFVMLPIFTIYPQAMPEFLSAYLFVLGLLVLFSTLLRGFRAQQMTYAPLNVAASWAPENEADELDSAAAAAAAAAAGNTAGPAPDGNGGGDGAALSPSSKQQQQHPQQHQPGTEGSVVQPLKPSGGQSPTAHRQPTMPKESSGRAVQILTPTARTPTSPSAAAATTLTLQEGGYGPASKLTRPAGLAAATAAPTIVSVPPSTAAAATAPAVHLAPPSLTVTNPAAAASSGLMAGVMPLVPPGVPSIVPVNAAIREVEESFSGLLGVGVSGSANNSFANSAAVHVVGSGSYSGTARDSPHRRRPSTHDSAGSPHAHPGAVTIGPGVAPMPVVTTSRVATNPSTAATSPTHGAPPAYPAGMLPLAGPPNLYAVHAHVGMSRSESDGAMSGRSVNSPASLPIPYATNAAAAAVSPHNSNNNNNNSSGSGSGGSSSRRGRQLSPSHVVAASARSTKHDGHTTWGDQVGDE